MPRLRARKESSPATDRLTALAALRVAHNRAVDAVAAARDVLVAADVKDRPKREWALVKAEKAAAVTYLAYWTKRREPV